MRRLSLAFLFVSLAAAQQRDTRQEPPPDFPPSYQVHIMPSREVRPGAATTAGNYWVARGWDLKNMIAEAWHVDISRVDLPDSLDAGKHYDFAMVLPRPEDRNTIYGYVRQAIQDEFHLRMGVESQPKDVYVMTAPDGLSPAVQIVPKVTSGVADTGLKLTGDSLSAQGATMEELSHMLENMLGRLVVDETKIVDRFDVEVRGEGTGKQALIAMLHDKVGLVLTPARQDVEMLVVR